jgi:hypothetical protein
MRLPIAIDTPCGADFSSMTAHGARARLCGACDKVVHDLSGRTDDEVEGLLADGPVCVRYLYDVHGQRLTSPPPNARVIPAGTLLSKVAQSRWLRAAALASTAIVFEACGGNNGYRNGPMPRAWENQPAPDAGSTPDAGPTTPEIK